MKKIYLLVLVFMFVVSVSSVCAADNNTTDTGVEINNTGVVDTPTYNFKSICGKRNKIVIPGTTKEIDVRTCEVKLC